MKIDSAWAGRILERLDRLPPEEVGRLVETLLRERDFFEAALMSLPKGIVVVDDGGRIVWANASARDILSMRPGVRIEGKPLREVLRRPELEGILAEHESAGAPIHQREVVIEVPRPRVLSVSIVPYVAAEGLPNASLWVLDDRTEVERQREERRQTARIESLATLTAGVAHELKNPLNSMTIHVQLMRKAAERLAACTEGAPEVERVKRSAEIVEEEVSRLGRIVDEFLTAVRPIRPRFRQASINDLLMGLAELFGPECRASDIELSLELDPSMPPLRMDPELMRQALVNLIRNGIEAIHKPGEERSRSGRIVLRTILKADHALIEVEDDGEGIDEPDRLRIFEPYHTTKVKGTGLGLMVVYKCVHAHDGRIGLTSTRGVGTVFHIALPLGEQPVRLLTAPTVFPLEIEPEYTPGEGA